MLHYYPGYTHKTLLELSVYQFYDALYKIVELEKMFRGETEKAEPLTNKELINRAKEKGLAVPSKY